MKFYKGFFKPKNPQKYKGNPTNIVYRSSWELKLMSWFDSHPDILLWGSEELAIPYVSPIDNKIHRYFPDFFVKKRSQSGKVETLLIEVKPYNQTIPPNTQTKRTKKYINEVYTWGINSSKWKAADEFCKDRMWKFVVMTEKDLGING